MRERYEFEGTEQQYKKRIAAWKLDKKNIKDIDMRVMLRKEVKRKAEEGKQSEFFLGGKEVPPHKMRRFVKRKGLDDEMIVAEEMPTPSYITCHTPKSAEVPTEDIEAISNEIEVMIMRIIELRGSDHPNSKLGARENKTLSQDEDAWYSDFNVPCPASESVQLDFAAMVLLLIWFNKWTDLKNALEPVSDHTARELIPFPGESLQFIRWAKDRLQGAPALSIEFAVFFIFHLKRLNPEVGQRHGGQYELFVVALKLSEHAIYGLHRPISRWYYSLFMPSYGSSGPILSDSHLAHLIEKFRPNMRDTLILAKEGEWPTWREKLATFLRCLPRFPPSLGA